jgi:SulP family sulfate permease
MQDVSESLTRERAAERLSPWREWLFRVVPAFDSLRTYSVEVLGLDTMAGLTVAAVAVPQAMAYAQIAGIPPQYGLYTAIVMTGVGALFDSSKQLINGPTNAISIAVLSAVVGFGDAERIPAVILLAFLVGAVQIGITLLRLGDLTRYISHAVIVGFTLGAATLIVLDQVKTCWVLQHRGRAKTISSNGSGRQSRTSIRRIARRCSWDWGPWRSPLRSMV